MTTITLHDGSKLTLQEEQSLPEEYLKYPREKANRLVAERTRRKK